MTESELKSTILDHLEKQTGFGFVSVKDKVIESDLQPIEIYRVYDNMVREDLIEGHGNWKDLVNMKDRTGLGSMHLNMRRRPTPKSVEVSQFTVRGKKNRVVVGDGNNADQSSSSSNKNKTVKTAANMAGKKTGWTNKIIIGVVVGLVVWLITNFSHVLDIFKNITKDR